MYAEPGVKGMGVFPAGRIFLEIAVGPGCRRDRWAHRALSGIFT